MGITQTEDITLECALVEPRTDWPITLLSMREASEARQREPELV